MIRITFIIILIASFVPLKGQSLLSKPIEVKEVTVTADKLPEQQVVGAKMTKLESNTLKSNLTKSLSELLADNSSIYIKSMGQGALATASFRGTASNHTQVLWNGVSINSPQLGSFDFSQIPIYFVDQASLTHGAAAQQEGSGALGGSINFSNDFTDERPYSVSLLAEGASNETYTGAGTIRSSIGRLKLSSRGYYQQSENNYRYLNKVYSKDPFYERRKNADYKQAGFMQEVYYKGKRNDQIKAIAWWQFDDRSLPQSTIVNVTATEKSKTSNVRMLISYNKAIDSHKFNLTTAYLASNMEYSRVMGDFVDTPTDNRNNSTIAKAEYSYLGWKRLSLNSQLTYRHDQVVSDNYQDGKKKRNTTSLKLFSTYRATNYLHFDAQTTAFLNDKDLSAIYNLSARYRIVPKYLTLKLSNGYNHRVPTLNDLYWNPGGNPELKSETGFSSDIGLTSNPQVGIFDMLFEATYYHMDINNWIMWIPKGNGAIWEPVNFNKVKSQGLEVDIKIKYSIANSNHAFSTNYGLAISTNNSGRDDYTQGKQLPYIPRHKWNLNYRVDYKDKAWFSYLISFTDKRFTSADESYQTNAYTTHNAEIGYNLKLPRGIKLNFSLRMDNIFNAYYESTQYYPMPLRMLWGRTVVSF